MGHTPIIDRVARGPSWAGALATLLLTLLLGGATAASPRAPRARVQSDTLSVERYLQTRVGLSVKDMASMRAGHAVTKVLPSPDSRGITVVGVVAVYTSRTHYLARLADLPALAAPGARQSGIIGDPVTPADLQPIAVDPSEYKGLRTCKPGNCDFKLSGATMHELATGVDWKGPRAKTQLDSLVRLDLERFITAYRTAGNAAMVQYDDGKGVQSRDVFATLLAQSNLLREFAPALRDYLMRYPANRPAGARDLLYWSIDNTPPLRPTFTLNHLVVYTAPSGTPFIARKQIYADHYFNGAFELTAAYDAPELPKGEGLYIITVRRYEFDALPGGLFNVRGRVSDKLQALLRDDLAREQGALQPR
jgi:hypothetical protein